MKEILERYVLGRVPPGGFLTACLCNDFLQGVLQADDQNTKILKQYARFIMHEVPFESHGSPDKVRAWLKKI